MWTTLLLAAILSVLTQVVLVIAAAAARVGATVYHSIVLVCAATAPLAWMSGGWLFEPAMTADGRLFLVVMHLSLGGLFFHFMTLPDRSVTLRVLVEVLLAPGGRLSLGELSRRYGVRTMIDSRIRQLEAGRFLVVGSDGAIRMLPRGVRFGGFVRAGRRLFRIESAN